MPLKVKLVFFLAFVCVTVEVKGEIGTWFRQSHDHGGAASNQPHPEHNNDASKMSPGWKPPVTPGSTTPGSATPGSATPDKATPLHEILNATKGDMHKARRDTSSAAAAQSTTTQQAFAAPPPVAAPSYPVPVGYPPAAYPYPPFGGFFPGFGGGAGAGLNIGVDGGIGAGGYFPIIEKVIVIVGGGILILIFLAIIQAIFTKGGLGKGFDRMFGFDAGAAKSFAGSVDVNAGPFHASKSASGSVAFDQNAHLTQRVMNGVNQRW